MIVNEPKQTSGVEKQILHRSQASPCVHHQFWAMVRNPMAIFGILHQRIRRGLTVEQPEISFFVELYAFYEHVVFVIVV